MGDPATQNPQAASSSAGVCPIWQPPTQSQAGSGGTQPRITLPPVQGGVPPVMAAPGYVYNPAVPPLGDPLGLAQGGLPAGGLPPLSLPASPSLSLPSGYPGMTYPGMTYPGMTYPGGMPFNPGMMPMNQALAQSNSLWGGTGTIASSFNGVPQAMQLQTPWANNMNSFTNGVNFIGSGVGTINNATNLYNSVQQGNWNGAFNAGAGMTTSFVNGAVAYQALNGMPAPAAWSYINMLPAGMQFATDLATGQPYPVLYSSGGNLIESGLHGAAGAGAFGPYGQVLSGGVQLGEFGYTAIPGLATPNSPTTLGQLWGQGQAIMDYYGPYGGTAQILNGLATDPRADDPNGNFISQGAGQVAQSAGQLGLIADYAFNSLLGRQDQSMMAQLYGDQND
jgi:hypothetical protein